MQFVMPQYYGSQVGLLFGTAEEAAEHYLDVGWRRGVLPNPFVEGAARQNAERAEQLRTAVVELAAGDTPHPRWLRTSATFDFSQLVRSEPAALRHPGGLGGYLLNQAKTPDHVEVTVGPARTRPEPTGVDAPPDVLPEGSVMTWSAYTAMLTEQTATVRTILDGGLFDLDHYEAQLGKSFLSPEAGLTHYIEIGEDTGLAPHPFFEPEWYAAFANGDGSVPPSRRFLAFVAGGQLGEAGPHFDGRRQAGGGHDTTVGPFAEFVARPPVSTPAGTWTQPASPATIAEAVAARTRSFRADRALLGRSARPLARHVRVDPEALSPATSSVLILVDARLLHPEVVVDAFGTVLGQEHASWTCQVVVPDDVQASVVQTADLLAGLDSRVHTTRSAPDESYGATVERVRTSVAADAVVFWNQSQIWDRSYLSTTLAALDAYPEASAAVSTGPDVRHAWLSSENPVWLGFATSAGLVVRSDAFGTDPLFATDLDGGIEWDLMVRMSRTHVAAIVDDGLVGLDKSRPVHDRKWARRLANEVRARHELTLDRDAPRVSGRVSILMPTFEDWWMTVRAVRSVLDHHDGVDVEIVVLDNGSRRSVSSIIGSAFGGDERVVIRRVPRNVDFALGSNLALEVSTGEVVVFLNNDVIVTAHWLPPLLEALQSGAAAAQPLLLFPNGTIQTAGTVFLGAPIAPVHLLAHFPAEDAHPALADHEFSALTAACLAMRAEHALSLGGFDCRYVNGLEDVDLCLRLPEVASGPLRVVPDAVVWHYESQSLGRFDRAKRNRRLFAERWHERLVDDLDDTDVLEQTHLRIERVRSRPLSEGAVDRTADLLIVRPSRTVESGPAAGLPRLRWAIKLSAPGHPAGDVWGDRFFADDLAASLRELGQEVVLDRNTVHVRPASDHVDDVTLTLRGLRRFQPQPGATNLLWVISHPDLVSPEELRSGWDAIYSAGPAWADQVNATHGVGVRPLLQATNARRFSSTGPSVPSDVLFVGRTRKVMRPVVRDAIAAGADLSVFGNDGWEQLIDPSYVKAQLLSNDELPAAYRGARIVLNDHWADMAAHGFLSNRLFDAAAAGALVVSDDALGLRDVFGDTVQVYTDVESLSRLLGVSSSSWPDDDLRLAEAARIRELHSFDVRARTLLADVLDSRGVDHPLRD